MPIKALYTLPDQSTSCRHPITVLLPRRSLFHLIVLASMQHKLVRMPRSHAWMALGPIIRYGVSKYWAIAVKGGGSYWPRSWLECWWRGTVRCKEIQGWLYVLFKRVRASLSQKWMVPSDPVQITSAYWRSPPKRRSSPQVENVPWTGWNDISFTAYTNDWSFEVGFWSRRWHLKEKLFLKSTFNM